MATRILVFVGSITPLVIALIIVGINQSFFISAILFSIWAIGSIVFRPKTRINWVKWVAKQMVELAVVLVTFFTTPNLIVWMVLLALYSVFINALGIIHERQFNATREQTPPEAPAGERELTPEQDPQASWAGN